MLHEEDINGTLRPTCSSLNQRRVRKHEAERHAPVARRLHVEQLDAVLDDFPASPPALGRIVGRNGRFVRSARFVWSQCPTAMSFLTSFLHRLETRRDLVLDVLRVYLGAGLFFRGLALLLTDTGLQQLTGGATPGLGLTGVSVYVTGAHLIGGALLTVGLFTRWAALAQLPILLGAVTLVHWQDGLLSANQSLEFSALVLFLLLLVCLFGGGQWSLDARWRNPTAAAAEASTPRTA